MTADLKTEDDDGLGWLTESDARVADRVRPGAMLLACNEWAKVVVRVVAGDDDGQILFSILPGLVAKSVVIWPIARPSTGRSQRESDDTSERRNRSLSRLNSIQRHSTRSPDIGVLAPVADLHASPQDLPGDARPGAAEVATRSVPSWPSTATARAPVRL